MCPSLYRATLRPDCNVPVAPVSRAAGNAVVEEDRLFPLRVDCDSQTGDEPVNTSTQAPPFLRTWTRKSSVEVPAEAVALRICQRKAKRRVPVPRSVEPYRRRTFRNVLPARVNGISGLTSPLRDDPQPANSTKAALLTTAPSNPLVGVPRVQVSPASAVFTVSINRPGIPYAGSRMKEGTMSMLVKLFPSLVPLLVYSMLSMASAPAPVKHSVRPRICPVAEALLAVSLNVLVPVPGFSMMNRPGAGGAANEPSEVRATPSSVALAMGLVERLATHSTNTSPDTGTLAMSTKAPATMLALLMSVPVPLIAQAIRAPP